MSMTVVTERSCTVIYEPDQASLEIVGPYPQAICFRVELAARRIGETVALSVCDRLM